MELFKIETDRQLFIIAHPGGFTSIGFENARRKALDVHDWLTVNRVPGLPARRETMGTADDFAFYDEMFQLGAAYAMKTGRRCNAELVASLEGLEGRRVEVVDRDGERRRFKVGKSTGWMPCHLELTNSRATGGFPVYGAPFQSVKIVR